MTSPYSAKRIIIAAIAIFVVIAAIFAFMRFQEQKGIQRAKELERQAGVFHRSGETEKSIPLLQEAADLAKDPAGKGRILLTLYTDYLASGDERKRREGVLGLKSLAEDSFFRTSTRAAAYMNVADVYYGNVDEEFARSVTFSAESFGTILEESHGDVRLAVRKLYERSVALFPYSKAHLRIGIWYGDQVLHNPKLTSAEREQYVAELDKNAQGGNNLFDRDAATLELVQRTAMSILRARASAMNTLLGRGDRAQTEALYQAARTLADSKADDAFLPHLAFISHIDNATFLYRLEGNRSASEIRELLRNMQRFATDRSYGVRLSRQFLINQNKPHGGDEHVVRHWLDKEDLISLSTISDDFKALLRAVGWVI